MKLTMKKPAKTACNFIWISLSVFAIASLSFSIIAQTSSFPEYQSSVFTLKQAGDRFIPIDINRDGLIDIVTSHQAKIAIYFQQTKQTPFNFSNPDIQFELPGRSVGWDLDWYSDNSTAAVTTNNIQIVAIVDGKEVIGWPIVDQQLGEPKTHLSGLSGNLPLGAYPLHFVRDINNDNRNDYIIPGSDHHQLFLQTANGKFEGGIHIRSNFWIQSELSLDNSLTEDVGQSVRIPEFRIRDVNNDGVKDLISQARNQLDVFLSNEQGSYNTEPSYTFDASEIEERLGQPDLDNLDFSNLSAMARYGYDISLDDVTGDKVEDLIIREAGKISVFAGTTTGMDFSRPRQILRSSGNVLGAALMDEDGDGLKDLFITRIEDISLGKAFVWLALSGSVDLESYIYKNRGEKFANRPHRKVTITITFPSLFKSISLINDAQENAESADIKLTSRSNINGGENDLLILGEEGVNIHLDVLEAATNSEDYFLGLIEDIREQDEFVIDLNELLNNISVEGRQHINATKGNEPAVFLSFENQLSEVANGSALFSLDLNSDDQDDIILFNERNEDEVSGILYLSQ